MPKHTGDDANHLTDRVVVPHPPGFATPFSRIPTFPITKLATSSQNAMPPEWHAGRRGNITFDNTFGRKDRYAMLSPVLLERLRAWWHVPRAQGKMLGKRGNGGKRRAYAPK
jgi:hypothetical protein